MAACVPFGPLVAMRRDTAQVFQDARHMQQVPRHESCVAPGKLVVESGAVVTIGRARSNIADPAAIGLRRHHEPDMLQRIQKGHGYMFNAVLVASNHAAAGLAVIDELTLVV